MLPTMTFQTYDAVPEWARFLSLEEFRAFLDVVEQDLRSRSLLFQDRGDALIVASPDGQIAQCSLAGVALKCGAAGRDAYAREVAAHFDRLFGRPAAQAPFPERFDEVRSAVKVRVYRDEDIRARASVVSRHLAPELTAIVVYDLPNVVASVSPEHLKRWSVSPEEAFRVGITNVGREKITRDAFRLGEVETFALTDREGFAASQVFHLGTYCSSELGAIVAMPTRHLLLCYPIQPETVIEALRELVPLVDDIYQERAGVKEERHLLSSNLYWWREGKLWSLSAGKDLGGLPGAVVAPPQEFVDEVLSRAMGAGGRQ